MTKKVSKSSIKAPEVLLASSNGLNSSRSKKIHVSKTAAVRAKETEEMLEKIRLTPIYDRYGRPHFEGTPIGSGDRSWRRQHGIGAKYSRQCSLQGIGITRDSFLPSECRINEQMAMRDTPRSTKLSNETKAWAKKHNFFKNEHFMKKLRFVQKRVKSVDTLPNLTKEQKEELFDCIYKVANYSLLDKRQKKPPIGTSTREKMAKAQNWQGDTSGSSTDVFYYPTFKLTDKQEPRTVFGPSNQEEWKRKRYEEDRLSKEKAAPRKPHWSENVEMPQTMGTPNFDARIPTAPAFTFGTSERPPISNKDKTLNPPIYNVHIENDPLFLPRYKTFGSKYRSMGYAQRDGTKTRRPKSLEWGAPMPITGETPKNPTRYGLILTPKVSYSQYKLYG